MAVVVRLVAALAGALVVGCVLFNVIAYVGAARHRRRHPEPCPEDTDDLPWPARFTGFVVECAVTTALACTVPLALRRMRVRALDDRHGRRPVVFLHGYAQHTANFLWLMRRLRRDGWTHLYSVRHAAARGDIERSARRFGEALDRIRRETGGDSVDVVAHSMGGLVARTYVRQRGHA
ncbi:MAG TPA: alpha/beta fold hydrolase, partial [Candidatus Binatia bacterium]|nr:alpha/beta fold hydrolase [Candidatus Binatia bacterium]